MKENNGAELGRCVFCKDIIYNSETTIQHSHALFKNSKIVCGNCLLELRNPCLEAYVAKEQEERKEKDFLLDKVKEYGWKINPTTGKLVKIRGSKSFK
tara:strand:- start:274 stop:567 length:294 start_codon:yes stop_codon:yes gene_type:complete